jgi:hypothetical protein
MATGTLNPTSGQLTIPSHGSLLGREAADQHPISAISGLDARLTNIDTTLNTKITELYTNCNNTLEACTAALAALSPGGGGFVSRNEAVLQENYDADKAAVQEQLEQIIAALEIWDPETESDLDKLILRVKSLEDQLSPLFATLGAWTSEFTSTLSALGEVKTKVETLEATLGDISSIMDSEENGFIRQQDLDDLGLANIEVAGKTKVNEILPEVAGRIDNIENTAGTQTARVKELVNVLKKYIPEENFNAAVFPEEEFPAVTPDENSGGESTPEASGIIQANFNFLDDRIDTIYQENTEQHADIQSTVPTSLVITASVADEPADSNGTDEELLPVADGSEEGGTEATEPDDTESTLPKQTLPFKYDFIFKNKDNTECFRANLSLMDDIQAYVASSIASFKTQNLDTLSNETYRRFLQVNTSLEDLQASLAALIHNHDLVIKNIHLYLVNQDPNSINDKKAIGLIPSDTTMVTTDLPETARLDSDANLYSPGELINNEFYMMIN